MRIAALLLLLLASPLSRAQTDIGDADFQSVFGASTVVLETGTDCRPMTIYMARTSAQKSRGLMYIRSMPADTGMLFLYPKGSRVSMWMKNTVIPLDILFLDHTGHIINIASETTPFSLTPLRAEGPASYALELNAGRAAELGLKPGMQIFRHATELD